MSMFPLAVLNFAIVVLRNLGRNGNLSVEKTTMLLVRDYFFNAPVYRLPC